MKNLNCWVKYLANRMNEASFECAKCQEKFSQKEDLNKHHLTHSDERQSECHPSKKEQSKSSDLDKHPNEHADRKAFQCQVCQKSIPT